MVKFLFERMEAPLTDWSSTELKQAVQHQVQRLIEGHRLVRNKAAVDLVSLETDSGSVPGSPVDLAAHAGAEHLRYAKQIERLIRRYEPRLLNPQVAVVLSGAAHVAPSLQIQAQLVHLDKAEEFYFAVDLDREPGL